MDPDVPKLQEARRILAESVATGTITPADALKVLQRYADGLAAGRIIWVGRRLRS